MNLSLIENVLIGCVFPSALIAIIAVVSHLHKEFVIGRKRRETVLTLRPVFMISSGPNAPRDQLASQETFVRGYDSPELFREDLWLIRIDRSRKAYATSIASTPAPTSVFKADTGTSLDNAKLICAFLAQHPGSRCNN